MFNMAFDTASLAELVKLAGFKVLLDEEITKALAQSGQTITAAAVANTWEVFASPSGELASTIYPWQASPSQMEIRVDSPYGRRREEGFEGMTDSLGRGPFNDPAKPYLAPALADNTQEVQQLMSQATQNAMARMGASF